MMFRFTTDRKTEMLRLIRKCQTSAVAIAALMLISFAACSSSKPPPPSDKAAVEKELKQLNDNRQKEWGNK
jgi:hypothetical protein